MRIRAFVPSLRVACAVSLGALLALGPIGCGGGGGTETGAKADLAPEAKAANKNMEDFMKNPKK